MHYRVKFQNLTSRFQPTDNFLMSPKS